MLGLYFGGSWFQNKFSNDFGNIELDAVLEETHEWRNEVTTNPVEDGAPVTDHIIEQADTLNWRCFVTDTPITISQSIVGNANNRTQFVFDLLHDLVKKKEVVTVYTKHIIYNDMAIESVSMPRSNSDGEAIEFQIKFVNIRKVKTQTVDVPAGVNAKKSAKAGGANGAVAKKAEPKKEGGKKQPETVTKPSSTLSRVLN